MCDSIFGSICDQFIDRGQAVQWMICPWMIRINCRSCNVWLSWHGSGETVSKQ